MKNKYLVYIAIPEIRESIADVCCIIPNWYCIGVCKGSRLADAENAFDKTRDKALMGKNVKDADFILAYIENPWNVQVMLSTDSKSEADREARLLVAQRVRRNEEGGVDDVF